MTDGDALDKLVARLQRPREIFWGGHTGPLHAHPEMIEAATAITELRQRADNAESRATQAERVAELHRGKTRDAESALAERDRRIAELEAGLDSARAFIANLRVPQTITDAGLQVFKGAAALKAIDAARAKGST